LLFDNVELILNRRLQKQVRQVFFCRLLENFMCFGIAFQ